MPYPSIAARPMVCGSQEERAVGQRGHGMFDQWGQWHPTQPWICGPQVDRQAFVDQADMIGMPELQKLATLRHSKYFYEFWTD